MQNENVIYGISEDAIIDQVANEINSGNNLFNYQATLKQDGLDIMLMIELEPGGGFESGYEVTTLVAPLHQPLVNFSISDEGMFSKIGKLFGMQDAQTGYSEFDKKVVIKTDDADKVKQLFASAKVRQTFGSLSEFTLKTTTAESVENQEVPVLEFQIWRGLTDKEEFAAVYRAFTTVLKLAAA